MVWPIRLLLWLMTPITVFIRFFFSVASLAEEPASAEEETAVDVEALLEAGEEEGIPKRATATWSAPPSSSATSWCAK